MMGIAAGKERRLRRAPPFGITVRPLTAHAEEHALIPLGIAQIGREPAVRAARDRKAVELLEESLTRFWQMEYRAGVSAALDDLSCALAAGGGHEEAMRVAGTATALREEKGVALSPQAGIDLEHYLGPVRKVIGDEAAERLFGEGRVTALEEAVSRHVGARTAASQRRPGS